MGERGHSRHLPRHHDGRLLFACVRQSLRLTLAQQQWADALRGSSAEVEVVWHERLANADSLLGPVA